MLRRAACAAAFVTAGLCAQLPLPAQSPADPPDEFVTAIVTLRDQAVTRVASTVVAADAVIDPDAHAATAADEFRASRGRALVARVAAAQRASQSQVRSVVGALGGTTLYAAQAVNAVTIRLPRAALDALRARSDVAFVEIDEPRHASLDHVPSAMLMNTFWSAGITGGSIDVAVIDTGLYTGHEAFVAKAGSIVNAVFHDAAKYRSEYTTSPTIPTITADTARSSRG